MAAAGPALPRGKVDLARPAAFDTFVDPAVATTVTLSMMRPWEDPADTRAERRRQMVRALGNGIFARRLTKLVNTPGYALTLSLAPSHIRGTTMAVLQVMGNLFSYGVGPQLVGSLSDALQPLAGANSLRYSVAIFALLNLWSIGHFLRAAHWMRRTHAAEQSRLVSVSSDIVLQKP